MRERGAGGRRASAEGGAHGPAAADPTGRAKRAPLSTHRGSCHSQRVPCRGRGWEGSRGAWGGEGRRRTCLEGIAAGRRQAGSWRGLPLELEKPRTDGQPLATPSAFTETLQPTSTHRTALGLGKSSVTHCPRGTDWGS